jgi:tRNA threonylcarbamoyl adenosine modification protein (Sua5/YciO/YrdC/YwlC family)
MTTQVFSVVDRSAHQEELERAGEILRRGGLVAFPTETVYGIAVAADLPDAVERLYALKERPRSKPMTVMVADVAPVLERCTDVSATARGLMRRFWPGPLTLVLPAKDGRWTGFRLPDHPLARGLVREAGVPLLVPSANRSGLPPATTAAEVLDQFPSEIDLVIDGGPAICGAASTVVRVDGDEIDVLREGVIPESRLRDPHKATVLFVCHGNTDRSPLAAALLRRHLARQLGVEGDRVEDKGYRILSAGIAARPGKRASVMARRIARAWADRPLDLDDHRSRGLTTEIVESATRIICMEREQREQILAFFPHRERDVMLIDPEGRPVLDPVGQGLEVYERLARRLDAAAQLIALGLVRNIV